MSTWRQYYAPMIAKIIADNRDKELKELKKILQDANPGIYNHMRKTWANEYMVQLGLSRPKTKPGERKFTKPNPNQGTLL